MGILSLSAKTEEEGQDSLQEQARVQCNVPCELTRIDNDDQETGRLREFNWYGIVVDQLDPEFLIGQSSEDDHPTLKLKFEIPRQFGIIELTAEKYVIHRYQDVIADDEKISLSFSLAKHENLKHIRDFIIYRNKSFIRSEKRKNSRSKDAFFIYVLWAGIAAMALFYSIKWFTRH